MRFSHLKQIAAYMQKFSKIAAIYRVDDTTIKIAFDHDATLYFAMQKGEPYIFTCKELVRSKVYQAPFDIVLAKQFNRASIDRIELYNGDKILRIHASQSSAYKQQRAILQLEFTGKTANAIIINQELEVLEALRHIDADASYRVVKVGVTLLDPPPPPYTPKAYPIENIPAYLDEVYTAKERQKLEQYKKQKRLILHKKLLKLQGLYDALAQEELLQEEAQQQQLKGHLILANMYQITPYQREITLHDFEGNVLHLELPRAFSKASDMAEYFFKQAKKLGKKAQSLHIEREGLQSKIDFTRHFIQSVEEATSLSELKTLFPSKMQQERKSHNESLQSFFYEGYKVMLGKNEKGNIALLEQAKARDIWLHLKDAPSAHVIIVTDKQNVPQHVIEYAAKVCVDFSVFEKGRYLVDYTPRREVKIQEGANVLYYNYKTLTVEKG